MKGSKVRVAIIAALLVVLIGTGVSWGASSGSATVTISSTSSTNASVANGQISTVTSLGGTFTVVQGKAQVISGVRLFQIDLAQASWSDDIMINFMILDPQNMTGALSNPNAWIDVQVWYADAAGTLTIADKDANNVLVKQDTDATQRASRRVNDLTIYPTVSGESSLYILASITTPGGIPPGQQAQLDGLQFYVKVKKIR